MNDVRADRIGWRQIMAGYVVCLCSAAALLSGFLMERLPLIESAVVAVVVLITLLSTWLEPHLRQWQAQTLATQPVLDLRLKRAAVAMLCLVSLATTALGVVVWRIMFFS